MASHDGLQKAESKYIRVIENHLGKDKEKLKACKSLLQEQIK